MPHFEGFCFHLYKPMTVLIFLLISASQPLSLRGYGYMILISIHTHKSNESLGKETRLHGARPNLHIFHSLMRRFFQGEQVSAGEASREAGRREDVVRRWMDWTWIGLENLYT